MMLPKINDYTLVNRITSGGFANVYLVHSVDKDMHALKLIPVTKDTKVEAKNEAEMYVQFNNPTSSKQESSFTSAKKNSWLSSWSTVLMAVWPISLVELMEDKRNKS